MGGWGRAVRCDERSEPPVRANKLGARCSSLARLDPSHPCSNLAPQPRNAPLLPPNPYFPNPIFAPEWVNTIPSGGR